MGDPKKSYVKDENGNIIGMDTTYYNSDGSSRTVHQKAVHDPLFGPSAGSVTGETRHKTDGTSTEHSESSTGGCFLTTACVEQFGLGDDCRQLTVLRKFRDEYVRKLPEGEKLISEYYSVAPRIVEGLKQSPDCERRLTVIFYDINRVVSLIEAKKNSEALVVYQETTGIYELRC